MKNIIVIGAGATGLMAARLLAKAGKQVIVLEARNRTGGRIHSIDDASFFKGAELGAEFVHGDLPVTLALLDEAGIGYSHAGAEMWHYKNGKLSADDVEVVGWGELMANLIKLRHDTSISNFLNEYFPEEKYEALKKSVLRFVAGYDTADPDKASAFALREEWQNEDDGAQHRVEGGYCRMINYLVDEIKSSGNKIYLNAPVKAIDWSGGLTKVITLTGDTYEAEKVLLALPLGILQLSSEHNSHITFQPEIPAHYNALQQIGFGAIIKILLRFDEPFWEHARGKDLSNMTFLLSEEKVPTWWTQAPQHEPVLTGWLGGGPAKAFEHASEDELFDMAIVSLSNIFDISIAELKDKLIARYIVNWTADPYTRGSYAYDTVTSAQARSVLSFPVKKTLYFAGEYLYQGPSMGTVEAALTSGKKAAETILTDL
ncbi:flavin monoamine oxidase family protein [Mucilaginibacter jinjuensis]|uniref:Tryptophan 2-monooxygenase n=1 Tax=Mucilaginibacter jinjuensis TaxID=1176721 RepID=A0ABY7T426_9SPHI|nr:NAD(P)/FAD-dependent oxidoreductase [Mucilaginibacter jinjuensis]WCT11204.1 NAD(P)/FAD-dependent oxidoreductase [Mucilaginibacter jinjuensis]